MRLLLSDSKYHKLNQNIGKCLVWASQVSFATVGSKILLGYDVMLLGNQLPAFRRKTIIHNRNGVFHFSLPSVL